MLGSLFLIHPQAFCV